jgi:hypothetical protein
LRRLVGLRRLLGLRRLDGLGSGGARQEHETKRDEGRSR